MKVFYSLIFCMWSVTGMAQQKSNVGLPTEANQLVVKFRDEASASAFVQTAKGQSFRGDIEFLEQRPFAMSPQAQLKGSTKMSYLSGIDRIYHIRYKAKKSQELVIKELMASGDFEYVEPLYLCHTYDTPNDAQFAEQYALVQVRAPEAWDLKLNASGQLIAIIDSGSELDHPDLSSNIFLNTADPLNGLDDDGDGYIDNYRGWDFVGATSGAEGDNDPNVTRQENDHGVHVSGIASAVSRNGLGVASISGQAKMLILKAAADNDATTIYPSAAYDAMVYAADRGAKVINCSWGRTGGYSAFEQDIINYAIAKGCLIVAAAGNSSTDVKEYPAAYQGVLAVANVNDSDVKDYSSSYGTHVGISAPGTNILSTVYGGAYGYKSGTSMATPMVSSAAALVAAYYPELNGLQIGEILRLSADPIDQKAENAAYVGQLGSGRLNVFKALSMGNSPAIRKQQIETLDTSGYFAAGASLQLRFLLKNFLQEAGAVEVSLSSDNTNIEVIPPSLNLGELASEEEKWTDYFKVNIPDDIAENEKVLFRLNYKSMEPAYEAEEYFSLQLNRDFINYEEGDLKNTFTSNGRFGFNDAAATEGNGFQYKEQNLLYEGSFLVAANGRVMNNSRTRDGAAAEDWVKSVPARKEEPASGLDFQATATFDDSGNDHPLGLEVNYRHYLSAASEPAFVIAEYDISNISATNLDGVYSGLFSDFDIGENSKNNTAYLQDLRMSYTWSAEDSGLPYAGIKVLNAVDRPNYYPLSYMVSGDPLEDDLFSDAEKIKTLSSGIAANGLGESFGGLDVMSITSLGPFNIPSGGHKKVAFALLAASNLEELKAAAQSAQAYYDQQLSDNTVDYSEFKIDVNYPNPVTVAEKFTTVQLTIPEPGQLKLELYQTDGRKVSTLIDQNYVAGVHQMAVPVSNLHNGIYLLVAYYKGQRQTVKMMVRE